MNFKEFNNLISALSDDIAPLNQILYEILILICFYMLFTNLKNNHTNTIISNPSTTTLTNPLTNPLTKTPISNKKSLIILLSIFVIAIDWFIWNNAIQTIFFTSILAIYIYYNMQNLDIISTFLNLSKDTYNALSYVSPTIPEPHHISNTLSSNDNTIPVLELPEILRPTNIPPQPFDIRNNEIKEIQEVYKSDKPHISITDNDYSKNMLGDLYITPQYKNIQPDDIDTTLDNNTHFTNTINNQSNLPSNEELLNSFRNPQKIFLDNNWFITRARTYNDNCVSCKHPSSSTTSILPSPIQGKNAICTVVPFGRQLSECTNQDNTISNEQLEIIADNSVKPLEI